MLQKRKVPSVASDTHTAAVPFKNCLVYFISLVFFSYYDPINSMLLGKNNLNHPFQASYLGLFTNNSTHILVDINLYYQPLQDPVVAMVFFILKILLIFLGEYLHYKVLLK